MDANRVHSGKNKININPLFMQKKQTKPIPLNLTVRTFPYAWLKIFYVLTFSIGDMMCYGSKPPIKRQAWVCYFPCSIYTTRMRHIQHYVFIWIIITTYKNCDCSVRTQKADWRIMSNEPKHIVETYPLWASCFRNWPKTQCIPYSHVSCATYRILVRFIHGEFGNCSPTSNLLNGFLPDTYTHGYG